MQLAANRNNSKNHFFLKLNLVPLDFLKVEISSNVLTQISKSCYATEDKKKYSKITRRVAIFQTKCLFNFGTNFARSESVNAVD